MATIPKFLSNIFIKDYQWIEFVQAKLPIFWIVGPAHSGKSSLAHVLSENSNYRLLSIKHLSSAYLKDKQNPHKYYADLLKTEIKNSFRFCPGYIIADFPQNMRQCRRFEKLVCEPSVVICISMSLDAALGRTLALQPNTDINVARMKYVKQSKFCKRLSRRYQKKKKLVSIFSQYPIQETHAKALDILETEFSYKFKQIVDPS